MINDETQIELLLDKLKSCIAEEINVAVEEDEIEYFKKWSDILLKFVKFRDEIYEVI